MEIKIPNLPIGGPARQVFPSPGDTVAQCSKCGCRAFRVHVRPMGAAATIVELVCTECLRIVKPQGQAAGLAVPDMVKNAGKQ